MTKDFDSEFHNLKKEFEAMKNSIKKINKSEMSNFSREHLEEVASQMIKDLRNFLGDRKDDYCEAKKKCEHKIKDNPFTALFSAVAVGTILGMIIKK